MGDVGSDVTKHFLSLRRLEIEEWSGVKFTRARMGIVDAINAVFSREQLVKFGYVVRKIFHIDRRILDIFARLGVADDITH